MGSEKCSSFWADNEQLSLFPQPVLVIRADGTVVSINRAAERWAGIRSESAGNPELKDIVSQEMADRVLAQCQRVRETQGSVECRDECDGRIIEIAIHLLQSEESETERFLIFPHDITDRAILQEEREISDRTARSLLDACPIMAALIAADGTMIDLNEAVANSIGLPRAEIVGKTLQELFSPAVAKNRMDRIREVVESGNPLTFPDFREGRSFEIHYAPIFNDHHEVVHVAAFAQDLTLFQALREARELSESATRTLLDSCPVIAGLMSGDGTVIDINDTALKSIGIQREEMIGKTLYQIFPEEIARRRSDRVQEVIETGDTVRFTDERNDRVFNNIYSPISDSTGEINRVAIFAQDITALRRSERLAAVGMATSSLAHSIKNIQSHLMGSISLLDRGLSEGHLGQIEAVWPHVKSASERINRLVKDMLSIAREARTSKDRIDAAALVSDMIETCQDHADRLGIDLRWSVDDKIPPFFQDRNRLQDSLLNLISNALEMYQWRDIDTGTVQVIGTQGDDGNSMILRVIDDGPGLAPGIEEKIFDPFFTTQGRIWVWPGIDRC